MAVISTTLMSFLSSGDHIVASPDVYGGTYGLLTEELPRFGIETTMTDMRDPAAYEAAIQPNTKIISRHSPTLCSKFAISQQWLKSQGHNLCA